MSQTLERSYFNPGEIARRPRCLMLAGLGLSAGLAAGVYLGALRDDSDIRSEQILLQRHNACLSAITMHGRTVVTGPKNAILTDCGITLNESDMSQVRSITLELPSAGRMESLVTRDETNIANLEGFTPGKLVSSIFLGGMGGTMGLLAGVNIEITKMEREES